MRAARVAGRRRIRRGGPLVVLAAIAALGVLTAAPRAQQLGRSLSSASRAYLFLDHMMDKYASGSTMRLVQSYQGGYLGRAHFTDSFTYDDALIIDALLARGQPNDLMRAEVLGKTLLYIQSHDPAADGRIRAAYAPAPLTSPSQIQATAPATDVGNMAWVGQALVQLYARTGQRAYLNGALRIGTWLQTHTYDTRGAGGYTGGETASGSKIMWKSTEHNIDAFSLFTLLAAETHNSAWTARAAHARGFIVSMWNPTAKLFYVGTGNDGSTINRDFEPEDVNSWSYLALRDATYAASLDWDVHHLAVKAGGFAGVSFCEGDRSGVWFEGTSHLADALELRARPGDSRQATAYLTDVAHAQTAGPNTNGLGIIAASKDGLSDCDGDQYYASLHTGATAWYLLALDAADPFYPLK